jgi:predicted TIM-barrel fold metal-dependent hydrolase
MAFVDSHMHVNFGGLRLNNIIEYLDREKIDYCWLLTWEEVNPGLWEYYDLSIEDVYEAWIKYPSRIIPFYAPDPHKNEAAIQLEDWYKIGIRGCGELKAVLNWNSNGVKSILNTVQRLKMPLVFHMQENEYFQVPYSNGIFDKLLYYGTNYETKSERKIYRIPQKALRILVKNYAPIRNRTKSYFFPGYMLDFTSLEIVLQDFPGINFIAHGPMFWNNMYGETLMLNESSEKQSKPGRGIIWRLLKEYANLNADISGYSGMTALSYDKDNTKKFLSLFEDKILYGTDNTILRQKQFLDSLGLSRGTYEKIYGRNACRIIDR